VTFTATVSTGTPGAGTPTGTVTFLDGSSILGTGTLDSNGQATFSTSTLGAGNHTITVSYGGSANFAASIGNLTQTVSQASTTTSLTSSTGSSVFGQSVTFTATVSPNTVGSGIPTGSVILLDGSINLGTVALDTTGKATFSTAALNLGGHAISVIYSGDANFTASAGQISQSVKQATTSTSPTATVAPALTVASPLATSQNVNPSATLTTGTSVFGQSVTFTAIVSANSPSSGIPTGTVTFLDGSTVVGTATLDSTGKATFSSSGLSLGTHTIVMSYGGDTDYVASTGQMTQSVNPAASSKTTVTSSASTSVYGQLVTFTATVGGTTSGLGIPTGTATFMDGGTILGTVALGSTGKATFSTAALVAGSHTITVTYSGATAFAASSGRVTQTVNKATATATVTSSVSSSVYGQPVTFTATLKAKSPGTIPAGTVVFMNGTSIVGTGSLDSTGKATFTISKLNAGSHTITISYAGSANFTSATAKLTQAVKAASTTTVVTSSSSSSIFGQSITFTATVTPIAPGGGIPTGKVTFMDGKTVLWSGLLDSTGTAFFTISTLTRGTHKITVRYAGVTNYAASSGLLTQLVTIV
jgi:hypothetical protein